MTFEARAREKFLEEHGLVLGLKGELLDVDSAEPCAASDFVWEAGPRLFRRCPWSF